MSTAPTLQDLYQRISPELVRVEAEIERALRAGEPAVVRMAAHASGRGGKRMRPAMVFLLAGVLGRPSPSHVQLAAVVEMIHLATLVHDDVIDGAAVRRRQSSVNALFSNHDAVLLGDIVFARAIHMLAAMGDQRALLSLTRAVSRVCEGEILQNSMRRAVDMDEATYYRIIDQKTAELYAAGSALAAHFAGAGEPVVAAFESFGREVGLAFQITDDCLDLLGDEDVVGKSLGTDLLGGKMTLPLILLRDRSPGEGAALLRSVMGGSAPEPAKLDRIRELLRETGANADALARARSHVDTALAAAGPLLDAAGRATLSALASFVLARTM